MPNIITPSKELLGRAQGRVRVVLVVSRPYRGDELVFALARTIPALLVLVYSSREALEITEAIKPDAFILDAVNRDELGESELYELLHTQPGFNKIPAILIGKHSPEQHYSIAKQKVVHLPCLVEPHDLQSALEMLLNIPKMPVRPDATMFFEHNSPSVA